MCSCASSGSDNDLLRNLNSRIIRVFDPIAPVKAKITTGKQKAPQRNATVVVIPKREHKKAEHKWRKNGLQIHLNIYKENLWTYNSELSKARQTYIINTNLNNSLALFIIVDKATNPPTQSVPEFSCVMSLCLFSTAKLKILHHAFVL